MPRVKANDTELSYQESGTGPEPLVLVHGWMSSSRMWVESIPRLPLKRYHVYAFDLRGAGRSDRPPSGHRPEQYADDIAAALAALGVETFHYVGHSMGGLTGMQLALRHAHCLRRLVLVAPVASGGLLYGELLEAGLAAMAARRDASRYRALARSLTRDRPLPERLLDLVVEDATTCSEEHAEESWRTMNETNVSDRLCQISAPTLMVAGDRDRLRPFNLEDAARIPNCALHVFYRTGHLIPYDVPQAFADLLAEFLEHGPAPAVDGEKWAEQWQSVVAAGTGEEIRPTRGGRPQ